MSLTVQQKRSNLIHQFFDQYLEKFFFRELEQIPNNCHLAKSMLIFSALDFYGKIYRVGENGFPLTKKGKRDFNDFNNGEKNYNSFIRKFFPANQSCKGIILYRIFRCGIMHQIVPKGAGVNYVQEKNEMFFQETQSNGQTNPILNLFILEKNTRDAITTFKSQLSQEISDQAVERIYNELIAHEDAFGDFMKLEDAVRDTITISSLLDDCL